MTKPKALILDIDGTIADAKHRLHLIEKETREWDAFYDAMVDDPPIYEAIQKVFDFIRANEPIEVFVVTGRRDTHKEQTKKWLFENGFHVDKNLLMRENGDTRPDTDLKKEIFETVIEPFYDVIMAFEDRPRIIKMWQELEIPVTDMGDGHEF